ncbi:MAG: helix-turn-helix transcriptional regulator [Emcibacter sp.]|nr:helix-turn-helix transcriptional regulator [Emcibacter sp.]
MNNSDDCLPDMKSINKHVGARILLHRKWLKMSQVTLGKQLGVSFQQIQKYEKGHNKVSAGRLFYLSRIFNVPIEFFYENIETSGGNSIDQLIQNNMLQIPTKKTTQDFIGGYIRLSPQQKETIHDLVKYINHNNRPSPQPFKPLTANHLVRQ